jgi:hypothetical protein
MTVHRVPTGLEFVPGSLARRCRSGDNWCITWSDDDHQYTSQDDGFGWQGEKNYNNRVWRIAGGPDDFRAEFLSGFPEYLQTGGWYGYGICSVDGVLYHFITRTVEDHWSVPFQGARLVYSPDHGKTWLRHDGAPAESDRFSTEPETMFFWRKGPEWAFSQLAFVQCGRDNSLARDEFVYAYSPNGKRPHELNLARVRQDRIRDRSAWRYFARHTPDGGAVWTETEDVAGRGAVHTFRHGWGLYSWLPSVVYNPGLDLFIMANGGTERLGDRWMHDRTGSLGCWWSEEPWGPWHQFYYTADWYVDSPRNLCYQPKLSPKWISDDGREMVLISSDAQRDEKGRSHTVNYRWNQQRVVLAVD